jgi:leucyl/phenylalanyl-tRNA--protein transferase
VRPLNAEALIECYRRGVFPMGEARDDPTIMIVEPHLRGVIDLDAFHVSRRLARVVRANVFEVTADRAFGQVVAACARASDTRPETWINQPIEALYGELHARGMAHSIECWKDGELVGGLYGVSLGGAFFGESMFSTVTDASKVALVHLVARLKAGGYALLDCQFLTPHLSQFGTREIPQAEYLALLKPALELKGDFSKTDL